MQYGEVFIGGGAATVRFDPVAGTITKFYDALQPAQREYGLLERVHRAFKGDPDLACPLPLEIAAEPPSVRMELCAGLPLSGYLRCNGLGPEQLDRLACTLARGLRAYVDATGEAYYDFCPQNALYDPLTGRVVLLDFALPRSLREPGAPIAPVPLSVGNFLGWSLYELARPANVRARPECRQYVHLYRALRAALLKDGTLRDGDFACVEAVARSTYRRVSGRGRVLRRAWYRSYGLLSFLWNSRRLRRDAD